MRSVRSPIELPRVVMRGALVVSIGGLVAALLLGLWRARADMREETAGAAALAQAMVVLAHPRLHEREPLLAELTAMAASRDMRHLHLQVRDAAGRALLPAAPDLDASAPMSWLVGLGRLMFPPPRPETLAWPIELSDGERWRVELTASPDSEQHEALARLVELLALLAAGSAVMLAVMHWHVRRSFRPLRPLLDAIEGLERQRLAPLRALPAMPIRELEAIASALRHLAGGLEQAEAARRVLSRQVLTLQEDERQRLARELHDELGQHLTALRVDASWLARRLAGTPDLSAVVAGMIEQCERIQQELRALLTRLRPLATPDGTVGGERETVARLRALLESLIAAWSQSPERRTRYELRFEPGGADPDLELPRGLVLAVYRISQEALTNVARHAGAKHAAVSVRLEIEPWSAEDGTRGMLAWSVEDDGGGLVDAAAWQRGNGLAGLKDRVWAAGGDLQWEPANPADPARPGLRLHARLPWLAAAQPRNTVAAGV